MVLSYSPRLADLGEPKQCLTKTQAMLNHKEEEEYTDKKKMQKLHSLQSV